MRSPFDVTLDVDPVSKRLSANAEAYVQKLKKRIDLTLKIAKDCVETAQDKYKQQIDKRSKDPEFPLDQRVWYYNPKIPKDKSAKLHLKWTGPYYITDIGPNHTFGLHNSKTHKKLTSLIHVNRLNHMKIQMIEMSIFQIPVLQMTISMFPNTLVHNLSHLSQ